MPKALTVAIAECEQEGEELEKKIALLERQFIGIACLPENQLEKELENGSLISVLNEYCKPLPALYLYYPHRNVSPALKVVAECLRA